MPRRVLAVAAIAASVAGCGTPPAKPAGTITVFAATSLTKPFTTMGRLFEHEHRGTKVRFNFAASSALVQQLTNGAPADVIASADTKTMHALVAAHDVTKPAVFAHNRLIIATRPAYRYKIGGLAGLASVGTVSLCAAEVPCGAYAAQALAKAHVTIDERRVTRAPNVAAALSAVTNGDAVAAIVYATDAKATDNVVDVVAIPDADNVIAAYPIAQVRAAKNANLANAFIDYVRGSKGQAVLRNYDFLKP